MVSKFRKHYLFASDFDQTLTFNDTGYVLSELLGISVDEFERKAKGMAKLNLVQQGAELAYLLLHDPAYRTRVRRDHLVEAGKRIRLKENIKQVYEILDRRIDGYHFDFYVPSASPVEVIQSALEGIVPEDHILAPSSNTKPQARSKAWCGLRPVMEKSLGWISSKKNSAFPLTILCTLATAVPTFT